MFKKDVIVTFIIALILTIFLQNLLFPHKPEQTQQIPADTALIVKPVKKEFGYAEPVSISLTTGPAIEETTLSTTCPKEPLDVYFEGTQVTANTDFTCEEKEYTINSTPTIVSFEAWNTKLFSKPGAYVVKVPYEGKDYEAHFVVKDEGFFGWIWNLFFNKPVYNMLIFLSTLFNNELGWAIIVLTVLLKLLLLIPTQRALESQKAMQMIQPKLKELQEKHRNDQQKLSQETMKLFKSHKVNPMGSCLPMLIQIPFLLALFFSVQYGLTYAHTAYLYPPLAHLNPDSINTLFLGILDLSRPEIYVLPITIALLQFIQMKMIYAKRKTGETNKKTKKAKDTVIEQTDDKVKVVDKSSGKEPAMPDMNQMNTIMLYALPIFIGFMAASFPAAVALYWGVQNLFGIGQQYFVNREKYTSTT